MTGRGGTLPAPAAAGRSTRSAAGRTELPAIARGQRGRMRTLVLGGYGNFGARISRALAADVDIDLLVAGRDAARARRFADTLDGRAGAVAVDCNAPGFDQALAALDVDLVIHTAGPFQEQSYAVALAGEGAGAIADFVEAQR